MQKIHRIVLFIVFAFSIYFVGSLQVNAQTLRCFTPEEKVTCQNALAQVEAEQKKAEAELADAQAQSQSLQGDIRILDAKIKTAELNIKAKNLLIQNLGNDIASKEAHISDLEDRIAHGKQTLAVILRKTNEIDDYSIQEVLLSSNTLAGFFTDIDSFESVREGLQSVFEQLRADQVTTTAERDALDQRRNKEIDARYVIQQEQKNIEANQAERKKLLAISKSNEKAYGNVIAQKQATAASIRAALFALAGGSNPIPFGQALQYATLASQKTGVRIAFILAILTQESALGSNVGACYLGSTQTGSGVNVKTGASVSNVMNPTRDVPPFLNITKALGSDPMKTIVSCPLSIGWGGAMGPAQFIASTWVLFESRIASALGISGTPNPWDPKHAFMASALYLGDLGAANGGYTSERNAACKYYSGRTCGLVKGNTTYGNQVVAKADTIQRTMINPLQGL